MTELPAISRASAARILARALHLAEPEENAHDLDIILPDVIRYNLYHLSLASATEPRFTPVYIRKITAAVRRQLEAVWPQLRESSAQPFFSDHTTGDSDPVDQIAWHLDKLAVLGDVVYLGDGFWMPGPIRAVSLATSGDLAIIGGMSTKDLRRIWSGSRSAGTGRLTQNRHAAETPAERQNYDEWVGWRPGDIRMWVKHEMLQTIREGSASAESFMDFEVYVSSWELRRATQGRPWLPAFRLGPAIRTEPVLLCRTRAQPHRYFLGHFVASQLKRERGFSPELIEWMQLGLGLVHGLSALASWRGAMVKLSPRPPLAVERHLLIYSYALQHTPGQFFYYVPPECRDRVEELLSRAGYRNRSQGGIPE